MNKEQWTIKLISHRTDDCFMKLPKKLLKKVNWKEGDYVELKPAIDTKDANNCLLVIKKLKKE